MSDPASPIDLAFPGPILPAPPRRALASPWKRALAFVTDGVILALLGSIAGVFFFNTLSDLGPWARLLGFFLALPYFVLFESNPGKGQTPGKRLMKLRVVNAQGTRLSFSESLLRYVVFAIPFFLNGVVLPASRFPTITDALLTFLVIGVGGTTLYLLVFNRNTRQGLHDLIVGAYVVEADNVGPVETHALWKPHWIIVSALVVALCAAAGLTSSKFTHSAATAHLLDDVRLIEGIDGVERAGATDLFRTNFNSGQHDQSLVITVVVKSSAPRGEALADQIATMILESDASAAQYAHISITITYGYDLGFASGWRSNSFNHTPAEWTERTSAVSP